MDLRRGHRHRNIYICEGCGNQHAVIEVVPWDKSVCRDWDEVYCVGYVKVPQCHQCSLVTIPVGQWPEDPTLWSDELMRETRRQRLEREVRDRSADVGGASE